MAKTVLVSGCAGFIGSSLVDQLLDTEYKVVGIDNFNTYYDAQIKRRNIESARKHKNFKLYERDILNLGELEKIFRIEKFDKVIHLAARAGVRPSINDPLLYAEINVLGTVNLLKLSVDFGIKQFIFGSSSSVYGSSKSFPFSEEDNCEHIISPYGASKRAAEFWVESFHKMYGLRSTILRFFTVYGPRNRPDMAPALFTKAILKGRSIDQFGDGLSSRDYTYIDDVVDGILRCLDKNFDFEIINLGNNHPVSLNDFVKTLEKVLGKKARVKHLPRQSGDVIKTCANINKAKDILGWQPRVKFIDGMKKTYEYFSKF